MQQGYWREVGGLSPAGVLLLTLLLVALAQVAAVYLLLHQPWTGLQIDADAGSGFVRVVSVDAKSPAAGVIQPNTVLTQVGFAGEEVPLTSKHFLFPFMHKSRPDFQVHLQQQAKIHAFLSSGKPLTFEDKAGTAYNILPEPNTPIRAIPVYFWVFLLVFPVVPLMGAFVFSYKSYGELPVLFFIASIANYGFNFIGVINFAKEFFFSLPVAEWLFVIELIFLNIYMPFVFNVMSSYPHRLLGFFGYSVFFVIFTFYSFNFYFSWLGSSVNYLLVQSILPFLLVLWVSQVQVVKSRHRPVDKMAARLMQWSLLAPFVPLILLHIIPAALGQEPIISKNIAQLLGITSFIGLTIGILQFRLFEVEYWWFKSWLWLLGGCVVVMLDLLLIGLLNTPPVYALGLSVVLTGFLYFPLRQWLLGKLMPPENQSLRDFLPHFSAALAQADSPSTFEHSWQTVLQARFRPQHLAVQAAALTQPALADNGLSLRVPALGDGSVYQLTGKHRAARLFSKADVLAASALLDIARMAHNASEAREQAVLGERGRLLHDLQATLGRKLRALADDLPEPQYRQAAEEALQTLESTVQLSLQDEPFSLRAHLYGWQTEMAQRTAAAGVLLDWQVDEGLEQLELSSKQALALTQFLREAVSNALKHAHPACLMTRFARDAGYLQVSIGNDGTIQPPEHWHAGTGLGSMRVRIRALGGDLHIRYPVGQGVVWLEASIPLFKVRSV